MTANLVTGSRIILSLAMLLFPVFSAGFYVCYLLAGFTDMVDGTIARKLGTESEFGKKLDTTADIVFVAASACRLFPAFEIAPAIWIWISIIAMIKIMNIVSGFVIQKKYVAVHSPANKVTGAVLFLLPFTLSIIDIKYSSIFGCLTATFASIQEGYIIRNSIGQGDMNMPLVRVEMMQGKTAEYKKAVLDCIHEGLMESIGIPDWDRFQRIAEIPKEDFETAPEKTDDFMIIELTVFPGRTKEQKGNAIKAITAGLADRLGIAPTDVFIVINEPPLENWGMGGVQKG